MQPQNVPLPWPPTGPRNGLGAPPPSYERAIEGGGADPKAAIDATREAFDKGWYFSPTLFSDAGPGMRISCEEVFGPVVTATRFRTEDEAIGIANDVVYGRYSSVWTKDLPPAVRGAE